MTTRTALIVGSTGLIGNYCLQALLSDPNYSEVTVIIREPILTTHRKLKTIMTNFSNIEHELSNIQAQDIYCCLGTTIKKAGSQLAFKEVDLSLVLSIAKLMRKQGAEQFLVISAIGADSNSKVFYSRVKGEMEQALEELDYPCLRIFRPSLLLQTSSKSLPRSVVCFAILDSYRKVGQLGVSFDDDFGIEIRPWRQNQVHSFSTNHQQGFIPTN